MFQYTCFIKIWMITENLRDEKLNINMRNSLFKIIKDTKPLNADIFVSNSHSSLLIILN